MGASPAGFLRRLLVSGPMRLPCGSLRQRFTAAQAADCERGASQQRNLTAKREEMRLETASVPAASNKGNTCTAGVPAWHAAHRYASAPGQQKQPAPAPRCCCARVQDLVNPGALEAGHPQRAREIAKCRRQPRRSHRLTRCARHNSSPTSTPPLSRLLCHQPPCEPSLRTRRPSFHPHATNAKHACGQTLTSHPASTRPAKHRAASHSPAAALQGRHRAARRTRAPCQPRLAQQARRHRPLHANHCRSDAGGGRTSVPPTQTSPLLVTCGTCPSRAAPELSLRGPPLGRWRPLQLHV